MRVKCIQMEVKMPSKYDHSQPLNLWLANESSSFEQFNSALTAEVIIEQKNKLGVKRIKQNDVVETLKCIVSSLIVTALQEPSRYLTYTRNKQWFSQDSRYIPKRFSHSVFSNAMDALESLGYIEHKLGFHDKGGVNSRASRVKAKDKLLELSKKHKVEISDFKQTALPEVILLKASKDVGGKKIDYNDTAQTVLNRSNLIQINQRLSETEITLETKGLDAAVIDKLGPFDITKKQLYRVFNNSSFVQGGRFYGGWWQEVRSKFRQLIRINGKRTVEMDYSSIHFAIMYGEKGLKLPAEDLYRVVGIDRSLAKRILNIAINAKSKVSAIQAIKSDVTNLSKRDLKDIETMLDKSVAKHSVVSEYFYSGKGLHLQYIDSKVAEDVMLNMWEKWGDIVLPVHDSFIVRRGLWAQLESQMLESFKSVTGFDCDLKVVQKSDELKTISEKLAQQIVYDDQGKIVKAGINASETLNTYKRST